MEEDSNLILDIFVVRDMETQKEVPQERFSEIQDRILTKLAVRRNRMKPVDGDDPRLSEQVRFSRLTSLCDRKWTGL